MVSAPVGAEQTSSGRLDVYKRQVVTPLIIFFLSDLAGFEFFCLFLPCMEPVSYTHLDVYKRQGY